MECIFSNVFRGGDFLRILTVLSDLMVPLLIFYVVGLGLLMKQDVFGDFLNGAKDGMRTVIGIVPTLIGLMAAVGVLRSSGFLEDFGKLLGTVLDLYKEAGCDSFAGRAASIIMSCTETVFYTMTVYFGAVRIKKTRYTLAGALFSSLVGMTVGVLLARLI